MNFKLKLLLLPIAGMMFLSVSQAAETTPSDPDATPETSKITTSETIVVTAPGEVRVEQELTSAILLEEAPGVSAIKTLAQMPSVNYQAADPYGSYEWAVRISVRGFNQTQLGFTLDDIPLGDMSYGNWNGLHISRAIASENMGRVVLSQGTASLETASSSNLGGAIQFYSVDPSDKRGGSIQQSFGSFNAMRTFARYDTGLIGGATKISLSGAYNRTEKWRGQGDIGQNYWQLNGKLVHALNAKGQLSVFLNVGDRREVDYQDVNKVWTQKLGYNWDNYGDWAKSIQAAWAYNGLGSYPDPVNKLATSEDQVDAAYYGGAGLRKDQLGYISLKQGFGEHVLLKASLYGHHNDGRGLWFTPYLPTYDNIYAPTAIVSPISLRTSEYGINRGGGLASISYDNGHNKLEGGVWMEGERWDLARRFYATSIASPLHSLYSFPSNPFYTQWEYVFNTFVYQFHVQDVYHVNNKLTLAAGFKTMQLATDGQLSKAFASSPAYVSGANAQGKLSSGKPFLPQFGLNYKLDQKSEIFGDAAYNVRSYVPGGKGFGTSPWGAANQAGFDALKKTLRPETSWTEEAGYRYTSNHASLQASFFHVNFYDRLLAFANGSGIAGNPSTLNNAGGVTTNGVDGSVSIRITPELTLYNALTWNRSTYDDNVVMADGTCLYKDTITGACLTIKGKLNVDTPEFLYKNSLEYAKHGFFGRLNSDYMGTRYFTYTNDGSVDGRFLADFNIGYSREDLGAFKSLKAQFSVSNLTNEKYYGAMGTNGYSATDPQSLGNPTLQVGAPRSLSGTISVSF